MAIYLLFIQHIIFSLSKKGKSSIVVPTGFLTATGNIETNIRKHIIDNKMLRGGARYTSKREDWRPICIVDGFKTKVEAMQCEWKLKRVKGYNNRVKNVHTHFTTKDKWTSKSPQIKSQELSVYIVKEYFKYFRDIPYRELYWFN
jgi:predicted GIY-YIG superfamily endonuclease